MTEIKSLDELIAFFEVERKNYLGMGQFDGWSSAWEAAKQLRSHLNANPPAAGPWRTDTPPKDGNNFIGYWSWPGGYVTVTTHWSSRRGEWIADGWPKCKPQRWAKINLPEETADIPSPDGIRSQAASMGMSQETTDKLFGVSGPPRAKASSYTWKDAFLKVESKLNTVMDYEQNTINSEALPNLIWVSRIMDREKQRITE